MKSAFSNMPYEYGYSASSAFFEVTSPFPDAPLRRATIYTEQILAIRKRLEIVNALAEIVDL